MGNNSQEGINKPSTTFIAVAAAAKFLLEGR
jgi:hypothetical protein